MSQFLQYFKSNFVENKSGWYEGFAPSILSQSNGIENSHKHFKKFEDIKERTPWFRFMKCKGKRLVEEWSKQRAPTFTREDGIVITNNN